MFFVRGNMHRLIAEEHAGPPTELPNRLAPTMASFRLLVLSFVRDYIAVTGAGPSYGEIAAKFATNRMRVKRTIASLEREGLVIRNPGRRGLALPSLRDAAVRYLRQQGFIVNEDARTMMPPESWFGTYVPVTKRTLLTTPALDYQPPDSAPGERLEGGVDGGTGGEKAGAGAKRAA